MEIAGGLMVFRELAAALANCHDGWALRSPARAFVSSRGHGE